MPKFILLFQGRAAADPDASDAQTQDYNRRWGEYMGGLARDGKLESGAPLLPSGKVLKGTDVSDLELAEFDTGGYMLLQADSIDEAVEIALRAPHVELGGGTIVRPCLELGP
jgi:hypothetical protein